jgi:hypothetical protein
MKDFAMRDTIFQQNQIEPRGSELHPPAKRLSDGAIPLATPVIAPRYVDPAAEAMSRNHNLSPPIHPRRD